MQGRFEVLGVRVRCGLLLLALAVMLVAQVWAGQQEAASIIGQVTDESGGVLPGVTVTAASAALQTREMSAVTNERGEYRLTPLPIGSYDVTYTLAGFQSVKRTSVRLTVGFSAKIDVAMKVGGVEETVTVSGVSPVVDVTSTSSATQLTRETLELTPTSRNGVVGLMAQAPGVRPNLDVGGSTITSVPSFHAFGQNGESWQTIEGVVTDSPKTGNQGGNYWDYSSFEEARVQTVGNDAETPNRGIMINAILRSGGNDFHGSGFWANTNQNFQSNNVDEALAAQGITGGNPIEARSDVSGDLGGRIVRDKLWFYYSARRRNEVDDILNAFKPDGSPATGSQLQIFSTEKVSYQMSQANRLVGFSQFNRKNIVSGVSQFTPWDSRYVEILNGSTNKIEFQTVRGSSLVASIQYGYWGWNAEYAAANTDHVATTDLFTRYNSGANTNHSQNSHERRNHTRATLSWFRPDLFLGNHEFKGGLDYMASRADRRWREKGAAGNYELVFNNHVPFEIFAWNYPVDPVDLVHYLGTYVEDSWSIARRLTLNLGVRYAHDNGFAPQQCRVAADAPGNVIAPEQCFDQVQFNVWNPISPRLHAAYDVMGNGKTVIKGGWGRFAHMRGTEEVQQANRNVATQTTYRWHDLNGNGAYDIGEVNLNPNGADFVSTTVQGIGAALAGGVPNPDEIEPQTDEFSGSIERELVSDFGIRLTGIYSHRFNSYRILNALRPYSVFNIPITNRDPGPDGIVGSADDPGTLVTYYDYAAAYKGAAFQLPMLTNDSNADATYKSLEIAASKRLSHGWQLMASYSATRKHIPLKPNVGSENGLTVFGNSVDPNAEIFANDDTWEWLGRLSGAYLFPYGVNVSANFEHRSGDPLQRTVLFRGGKQIPSITLPVEPLGSGRLPNINLFDVRAEKAFRFAQHRVTLRLNVYNSLNASTITNRVVASGPSYGRATAILPPRTYELSASYSF